MLPKNKCQTCSLVENNLQLCDSLQSNAQSGKKKEKKGKKKIDFKDKVLNINNEKLSFDDLQEKFTEEHPTWREGVISVPSTMLHQYVKKIPYYVTEDDVKKYLRGEFMDVMEQKKNLLKSPNIMGKVDIIIEDYKSEKISIEEAVAKLNENILEIIFIGEIKNLECKQCVKQACKSSTCPVKKGLKTNFDLVKLNFSENEWTNILSKQVTTEGIVDFAEKKLSQALKDYLSKGKEFDLLASLRGQKAESNLVSELQSHLNNGKPGLLISRYKVFSSLKNLLGSYKNIKLSNCVSDSKKIRLKYILIKQRLLYKFLGHIMQIERKI